MLLITVRDRCNAFHLCADLNVHCTLVVEWTDPHRAWEVGQFCSQIIYLLFFNLQVQMRHGLQTINRYVKLATTLQQRSQMLTKLIIN